MRPAKSASRNALSPFVPTPVLTSVRDMVVGLAVRQQERKKGFVISPIHPAAGDRLCRSAFQREVFYIVVRSSGVLVLCGSHRSKPIDIKGFH